MELLLTWLRVSNYPALVKIDQQVHVPSGGLLFIG